MGRTRETRLAASLLAQKKKPVVNSIIITPEAVMTYAQILIDLKQNVKPDEVDLTTLNCRKIANGNVLLAFKSSRRTPKITLEVRDLDETMT